MSTAVSIENQLLSSQLNNNNNQTNSPQLEISSAEQHSSQGNNIIILHKHPIDLTFHTQLQNSVMPKPISNIIDDKELMKNICKDGEYLVEKILKKKIKEKKPLFYVKWMGFSEKDNTWEPLSNLQNVKVMLYQYEYGLPQTSFVRDPTKKANKELVQQNMERIIGHDTINGKLKFLVSYQNIQEPFWVGRNDLSLSQFNQYQNCLRKNKVTCRLLYEEGEKRSEEKKAKSNKINQGQQKLNNKERLNNFENHSISIHDESKEIFPSKRFKKSIGSTTNQSGGAALESIERQEISPKNGFKKNVEIDKFFGSEKPSTGNNSSSSNSASSAPSSPSSNSNSDKMKMQLKNQNKNQNSFTINNESMPQTSIISSPSKIFSSELIQNNSKLAKNEDENIQVLTAKQAFDVEGSFEIGDKEKRIVVRFSHAQLEDMIFEVFWERRQNGILPKSKLVRYEELKKYSPLSLIYWLEVMVNNSVIEMQKDQARLMQQEEQINFLQTQLSLVSNNPSSSSTSFQQSQLSQTSSVVQPLSSQILPLNYQVPENMQARNIQNSMLPVQQQQYPFGNEQAQQKKSIKKKGLIAENDEIEVQVLDSKLNIGPSQTHSIHTQKLAETTKQQKETGQRKSSRSKRKRQIISSEDNSPLKSVIKSSSLKQLKPKNIDSYESDEDNSLEQSNKIILNKKYNEFHGVLPFNGFLRQQALLKHQNDRYSSAYQNPFVDQYLEYQKNTQLASNVQNASQHIFNPLQGYLY